MTNAAAAKNESAARHATQRIAAIRADIRQTERAYSGKPALRAAMLRSLQRDLLEQEKRLAEVW